MGERDACCAFEGDEALFVQALQVLQHLVKRLLKGPEDHRPKTRGIPETMVCRILMFMWFFGSLYLPHYPASPRPSPLEVLRLSGN